MTGHRWVAVAMTAAMMALSLAGCGDHGHDAATAATTSATGGTDTVPGVPVGPADTGGHGGHSHGSDAAPAEATIGPDGRWQTAYGDLIEVSAYPPGTEPDAGQRRAGEQFVASVAAAAPRFATVAAAEALGYARHPGLDAYHWVNIAFTNDGVVLDPARPEFVMFDPDRGEFLGVMFLAPPDTTGPQFAGPVTVWHVHDNVQIGEPCFDGSLPVPGAFDTGSQTCATGTYRATSPEMLHVWLAPGVTNPFASDMQLG